MRSEKGGAAAVQQSVPTLCYNCVAGPDFMRVIVEDGVATRIEPNHDAVGIHPGGGRPCVRAYGLVQKTYNPHRVRQPMKRTNPKKGRDEDPGFVPISWDEALDAIAARLKDIQSRGLLDEAGLPRVAASFGHGGTPRSYMGSFPAFMSAWGPIDFSFGSGQGVKCTHSEHLYGEYWHRAFTVSADTVLTNLVVSFGSNNEVTGGVCAVRRHADARIRGVKRIQIEPHLSATAACSAEWVPIKPKTDAAFMLAMIHVLLHETPRASLDLPFLRDRTSSPYLVGPNGYYLREPASGKPLVWDERTNRPVPYDAPDAVPTLEGEFTVPLAVSRLADQEVVRHENAAARTAFTATVETMRRYSPEWASEICGVAAAKIRHVANEYVSNAHVGETIEIEGRTLPFRPVAVTLGKTVNNGWGAFECCWSRTVLATLVGALEVPGGTLGTTVRLNKGHDNRLVSVVPGEDGFMVSSLNPTGPADWKAKPTGRNAHRTLVPIVGNSAWSQALGPAHLPWLFMDKSPEEWPQQRAPELWITFRTNPAVAFWDTAKLTRAIAKMPFVVAIAYTFDETNHMADILLPEAADLESTQLVPIGGTKFIEQFWEYQGVALRQKVVEPEGDARDFTWIATELARRTGLIEKYNAAINRGAIGSPLKGESYDFSLPTDQVHDPDAIWDAVCKASTATLSHGKEVRDLAWMKEHGFFVVPFKRTDWYLYPSLADQNLRFELPYQERLMRVGEELRRRLHEQGIHWWDEQLSEYQALPEYHDVPGRWVKAVEHHGGRPEDFPLWGITTKTMFYSAGNNSGVPLMHEVGQNVRGHGSIILNAATAAKLGIARGDWIEVRSIVAATRGRAEPVQGCHPDTIVIPGQHEHWKTPFAKELKFPSLNTVTQMSMELTDATGSGADVVRVSVRKVDGPGKAGRP
ncbi:MAG: molybdopterin-dependent oxidoreductase [Bradyrhizobiaceae bacterium]|nr:molybdopterin-dependent oxidoreductase [Bradyrhizobiaceae bacterium]